MKRVLGIFLFLLAAAAAHGQTAAPAQITLYWTNPTADTTSILVFRGTCAGTVTGTTLKSGAIVGQCTPAPAQSAMGSYYTIAAASAPATICVPSAPENGCFLDNAISGCIAAGCVYDIEAVDANGTSTPSGMIAVSWNAPATPPPAPPPAPTNLTIVGQAKTSARPTVAAFHAGRLTVKF